jgi:hypothetical protein
MRAPVLSLAYSLAKKGRDVNTPDKGVLPLNSCCVTIHSAQEYGSTWAAYITGNGANSLALTTPGSITVSLASRESGTNARSWISCYRKQQVSNQKGICFLATSCNDNL